MAKEILGTCPVCAGRLKVTKLACPECGTEISGSFETSRFGRLSDEQMKFLKAFLSSRGNLKEVEKQLGISYPTIRNRLDEVLGALGLESGGKEAPQDRQDVLDALERGELTATEAAEMLRRA
jgi:hypothetical protein